MTSARQRLLATTALLIVVGACSRSRPVVAPAPYSGTFTFAAQSSADSTLEGRFEGTATVANGWMTVSVPAPQITIAGGPAERWRSLTVRAFLATDFKPGAWKAVAQSRPVNIFRFIDYSRANRNDRRTVVLETPLTFMVPIPPGAPLATSRLAFELEWVFVVGNYGETDSRIAFSGPLPVTGMHPEP